MARVDTKTIAAVAIMGLVGVNYTRQPGERPDDKSTETSNRKSFGSGKFEIDVIKTDIRSEFADFLSSSKPPNHQTHFVIATIPDPDKTALRLYTDRVLDVLMLAAFEHKFVLIRQWLPWKFSLERPDDDYSERKLQRAEFTERAKYPGILVFEVEDHILFMLLVPETPTAGVNRDVLDKAVSLVGMNGTPIIGPSFTGGLESIREWIESSPTNAQAISRIVTGSVTGLSKGATKSYLSGNRFSFHWTRRQRYETDVALQAFLHNTRPCLDTIVQLAEDSTGFGRSVGELPGQTEDCEKSQPQTVQFPWQISRVRNAMPDVGMSGSRQPVANLFNLPLQLRETRRPEGAIPTFAGEQTPAAQEVVLAQITTGLERQPAEYVSVVATDILDSLFLVRLLRTGNPSQRVIVNDPDLLFLRAQDMMPTVGLLAASTFPQSNHLRLQDPQVPILSSKVFDSEFAASIFMAARDAIPFPNILPHNDHEQIAKRPLWLITLGRNGYWPVARLDNVQTDPAIPAVPLADKPTLVWSATFWMMVCAATLWLAALVAARLNWLTALDDLQIKFSWPEPVQRALTLTILTAIANVLLIVASLPVWFPLRQETPVDDKLTIAAWAGFAALSIAGFAPWAGLRQKFLSTFGLSLIAIAPGIAVLAVCLFKRGPDDYLSWRFFLIRSQDYLNGVGPLLPMCLLILGFAGCAWSSHLATILSTERFVRLGGLPGYPGDCRKRFNKYTFLIALLLSLLVLLATSRQIHSLERRGYDVIYSWLLAALLTWVLYACFNFLDRWQQLRRFLGRLELHAIRFVLSELPNEGGAPIWESHPRRRSLIFYGRAADCLRRLQQIETSPQVSATIASIETFLDSTREGKGAHRKQVEQDLSDLLQKFQLDLNRLSGPWLAGSSDLVKPPETSPPDRLKQEFIALRLSAYLRCSFLHIRNRLTAMTAGFVAITLSLNSYAFGPERVIQIFTIGLVIFIGVIVISVFAQMHQNPILLRMSGSAQGAMDWGFWGKVISAGALPLISLFASYTPGVGKLLGNWLQPALEAMGK